MCAPIAIPIVIGAISIGMQLYGNSQQAKANRARQRQAQQNSDAAQLAAVQVQDDAHYEASRLQMRADQLMAHVRTAGAAGNLSLSGGSPVRLQTDAQVLSAMDQHVVEMRGIQKAAGFILQGDSFNAQAAALADQGRADQYAALGGMAATAGRLGQQGYDWWQQQSEPDPTGYVPSPQPVGAPGDVPIT